MSETNGVGRGTLASMRELPEHLASKLLDAVDALGASFDEVRMDDIALTTGIPRATLYYYFSGKEDVLAFLLRSALAELSDTAVRAVNGRGTAATRLRAVIRAQLQHLADHPATSQLLIANLGQAGRLPDIAARVEDGFHSPVQKLLAEGAADGTLRDLGDPQLAATALFGAVLVVGLRSLVVTGSVDADSVTDSLAGMLWSGLAPDKPTRRPTKRTRALP